MSVEDAARRLDVSTKTIYRYLEKKKLTSTKMNEIHYIPREQVERMARSRHVPTDEKTRFEDRVNTLYELVGALDYRMRELEAKLAKLHTSGHVETPQEAHQEPVQETPVRSEMPAHLIGLAEYARQCDIPPTTLKKAVDTGRLPVVRGKWKVGRAIVQEALDETGRARVQELYGKSR